MINSCFKNNKLVRFQKFSRREPSEPSPKPNLTNNQSQMRTRKLNLQKVLLKAEDTLSIQSEQMNKTLFLMKNSQPK